MIRSLYGKKMKELELLALRKKKIAGKHRSDFPIFKRHLVKKKTKETKQ